MKLGIIFCALFLLSCSSTHLVSNWKNPEYVLFDAYQVLIVGMTQNEENRIRFETKLQKEFNKRGIEAIRSVDLFDVALTSSQKSEEELSKVEQQLLDKGFDAILLTKIVGSENRQSLKRKMIDINDIYGKFKDDYLQHQGIYYETDYYDEYTVYHAETSLYCICVDKERELIWRGGIDITDPVDIDKSMKDYVKLVTIALEEQDIIFRKELSELDGK